MYSGDEEFSDDITSPLERPLPLRTMQPKNVKPRRSQVKKVRKAISKDRPSVYDEFRYLYQNGTDNHQFGEE